MTACNSPFGYSGSTFNGNSTVTLASSGNGNLGVFIEEYFNATLSPITGDLVANASLVGNVTLLALKVLNSTTGLDGHSANSGSGTSPDCGLLTDAQSPEIMLGCIGIDQAGGGIAGFWTAPFNGGQQDGTGFVSNPCAATEGYLITNSTGGYTPAKTLFGPSNWASCACGIY